MVIDLQVISHELFEVPSLSTIIQNIWWYTLVSVYQKKDNLLLYMDILRNTKLPWTKELDMVIQRLYHSTATTVPSTFQIYFKCLLFSISDAISSAQGSVIPHLEYCNYLVFIHSLFIQHVSVECLICIRPWIRMGDGSESSNENRGPDVGLDVYSLKATDSDTW